MPVVTFLNASSGVIDPAVDSNFQVVTSGPNATFFYTTTLTFLRNTTVADEGIYSCNASNGFDTTTQQAMLTVNGKSSPAIFAPCCTGNETLASSINMSVMPTKVVPGNIVSC